MNKLHESITQYIKQHNLLPTNSRVVLGLSGGPDSVFLLDFLTPLHKAGEIYLTAAHLDHQWRENSHLDSQFCGDLAAKYAIPFISKKISDLDIVIDTRTKGSQEALGRAYRRCFLKQVCQETNSSIIALGHHADDQQETFFIRLIRGATLSGLASMRPKSTINLQEQAGYIIRPLLQTQKSQILDFLHTNKIAYLTDPTNISHDYLRNKLRLTVLPALHQADSRITQNFSKTIDSLQEIESFLENLTQQTFYAIATKDTNNIYWLSISQLLTLNNYLRARVLIYWLCKAQVPFNPSKALLAEIVRFLENSKSSQHILYNNWIISKRADLATITAI